jgi:hypothetical protein
MGTPNDNAATALALAGITPADYLRRAASLLDDAHHALDASELGLRSWLEAQIDELHSEALRLDAPLEWLAGRDRRPESPGSMLRK